MSTLNTFSPDLVKLVAAEKYERLLAEATAARLHQQIATKGSSQNRGVL